MQGGLGLDRKATPSGGDLSLAGGEGRVSPCSVLHDGELSVGGDADAGTDRRSRGRGRGQGAAWCQRGSHRGELRGRPS
jgi:hypothetical protein